MIEGNRRPALALARRATVDVGVPRDVASAGATDRGTRTVKGDRP